MTNMRTMVTISALLLGLMPLVACGSDRALTIAPSIVPTASGTRSPATPTQILPRGNVNTTTPQTVTSLMSGTVCPTVQCTISSVLIPS